MREKNLVTVTEDATNLADMDGVDLVAWINDDERHAAFFAEALETAWSTLDRHNLRTLSYVLAEGFQDAARLEVDKLVVRALRELDAPHIRVLDLMASTGANRKQVPASLPELTDGLDAIFAALERAGCLASAMFPSDGPQPLVVTDFGRTCLMYLQKANSKS
jgi:hypothetical protein